MGSDLTIRQMTTLSVSAMAAGARKMGRGMKSGFRIFDIYTHEGVSKLQEPVPHAG